MQTDNKLTNGDYTWQARNLTDGLNFPLQGNGSGNGGNDSRISKRRRTRPQPVIVVSEKTNRDITRIYSDFAFYFPFLFDSRVRKSKNFPDSKIFTAKTFRIKRVNRDIDDFATNARKT